MLYYAVKIIVSAIIIALISELAKRSLGFAALVASLPMMSLLAMTWMHVEGADATKISTLCGQIFWLALPSLLLFLLLPLLLKQGLGFWLSMGLSMSTIITVYIVSLPVLRRLGVEL